MSEGRSVTLSGGAYLWQHWRHEAAFSILRLHIYTMARLATPKTWLRALLDIYSSVLRHSNTFPTHKQAAESLPRKNVHSW